MAKMRDGSLTWLRDRNRQRVIDALRLHGKSTQADIARATGLSRTTVSSLIAELKAGGLIAEDQNHAGHSRGGRPGTQLALRDPSRVVVGIDFGHSHVGVAVANLAHEVLAEQVHEMDVNRQAGVALDAATRMFGEVLSQV